MHLELNIEWKPEHLLLQYIVHIMTNTLNINFDLNEFDTRKV